MEKAAFVLNLIVLAISPILFGAVHTWAYTLVFSLIVAASLLLLPQSIVKTGERTYAFRIAKTGMLPLFLAFVVLMILQMTSMPETFLFRLSPEAKVTGGYAVPAAGLVGIAALKGQWLAFASYVYPVRMSLIRWIVYGLFFLNLVQTFNSRKRIEKAILLIIFLGVLESLYGIVQTYSGSEHMLWAKKPYYIGDVTGTYDNRNHFAGLMEMGIVLTAAFACVFASQRTSGASPHLQKSGFKAQILSFFSSDGLFTKRILILFAGVVMGVGLILAKSRGGILAAAAALLVLGLFFLVRRDLRRKGIVILVLFLITSVYALSAGLDKAVERFRGMNVDYQFRSQIVQDSVKMFFDYPVAGVGVGNFRYAYPKYQSPEFARLSMVYAHNDWIQLLAEGGAVGMVLMLSGMGYYLFFVIRKCRRRHNPFAVCLGGASLAILVAMAIHAWSDFNLRIPANTLILGATLAIGLCALHLEEGRRHDTMTYGYHIFPFMRGGAFIVGAFLVLILWTGFWSFRHFVAEAYCPTESNPTLNLRALPPEEDIRRAMIWDGGNANYPYKRALVLLKRDDMEAQRQAQIPGDEREKAVSRDATLKAAIAALEETIRLNPMNAEYHVRLAWEYTHLWYLPDYMVKWMPAADISMERAAHTAGDWAENPHLHLDMGNYWAGRSRSLAPDDPKADIAWTKALWHYRKALSLDGSKAVREEIVRFVKNFYPDEAKIGEIFSQGER